MLILMFLAAICLMAPAVASDNVTHPTDDIKVSFNDTVYREDLGYIDVELPGNTSGNLKATINNVEFYNDNISSSLSIPITIPSNAVPIIVQNRNTDYTTYYINLFFNNIQLKSNHALKVMGISPDYSIQSFPSEILKDDPDRYVSLYFPYSANGEVKVFIDGEFAFNLTASHYTFLNATIFNALALGDHNVTVVYSGDSYYRKFTKTFNFTVVDMLIDIPQIMILDHDDCITAKTLKNRDGIVTVYVDDNEVFKDKLDENGEFLHSMFDDITCGEHLIEVKYTAGKLTVSKKSAVRVIYEVDMWDYESFVYGGDNQITIVVPPDFNKKLIAINIDGDNITDFEIDNSGWIEVDVSGLDAGNHTLCFNFSGDDKYYQWAESKNFTVSYSIVSPYLFDYDKTVFLKLPSDARGNLEVYINSKLYKSEKLRSGAAEINIYNLTPGRYDLYVKYTGSDYHVSDVDDTLLFYPDVITPDEMYCGENKFIIVDRFNGAKGKVIFSVEGKNYTVDIKDDKALLSLKNFKKGFYDDIWVTYVGDDGFNITLYTGVDILSSKITLTNMKVTSSGAKVKVNINGRVAANTYVTFKVDKKTKKVKTDKNGIATIKLNPGKHRITAVFKDAQSTKTVKVPAVTLNTAKVKKSSKKVVLTAKLTKKLKNKVIKFKFNGKTINAKTNSKGIAKATFKTSSLKVGKKITYSATYLKDTVKKTVTVKK